MQQRVNNGKQQPGKDRAVKPKGRAAVHRLIVLFPQGTAHHAGAAHAEQVIHRIEGQQQRCRQGDGGVLHRIVEHAHKIGVRQVVKHHDQRTEHCGHCQLHHRLGNGGAFKQLCFLGVFHCHTSCRESRKGKRAPPFFLCPMLNLYDSIAQAPGIDKARQGAPPPNAFPFSPIFLPFPTGYFPMKIS